MIETDAAIAAARAKAAAGEPPPWLRPVATAALESLRGHAVLVEGAGDVGQLELALTLAQAWLCEAEAVPFAARPCGECASCRLVRARSHPDLLVVVPEAMREALGWRLGKQDFESDGEGKAAKRKPSREIRIDDLRAVIEFASVTSARGRCKAVVIHPAERMNGAAANAFLKTLEEPAGDARFLLCSGAATVLLPTIRSRCQTLPVPTPAPDEAAAWLGRHGVAEPPVLLAASGNQPFEALAMAALGIDAARWRGLPASVAAGDPAPLRGLPLALVVDILQKLALDSAAALYGAPARYFPAASLVAGSDLPRLLHWMAELRRIAREAGHPWSLDLAVETLVAQGRQTLHTARPPVRGRAGASLHSPP